MFQANFLQGHKVLSQFTATFIHCSIGPLQTDRYEWENEMRHTGVGQRETGEVEK